MTKKENGKQLYRGKTVIICINLLISNLYQRVCNCVHTVFEGSYELLWKESLSSGDQQFHQYQQNKRPPLVSNHRIQLSPRHMVLEIQVLGYQSSPLIIGSPTTRQICIKKNKQKHCVDWLPLFLTTHYHKKMNSNMNMGCTITGLVNTHS